MRGVLQESALATFIGISDDNTKLKVNAVKFDIIIYDHSTAGYFPGFKAEGCEAEFASRLSHGNASFWINTDSKPAIGHYYPFEIGIVPKKAHQNEVHYARLNGHNNMTHWGTKG